MKLRQPRPTGGSARYGIDRMIRNVETGRFERSLSALTAAEHWSPRPRSTSSMTAPASATR